MKEQADEPNNQKPVIEDLPVNEDRASEVTGGANLVSRPINFTGLE